MLTSFHYESFKIWCMFFVALGLALVIIALCYIISVGSNYNEKLSSYECGFNAYEDSRGIFDVKFYLVAILFLIFDLEALFFFPWSVCLGFITSDGFFCMIDFIFELLVGYYYAWEVGSLNW